MITMLSCSVDAPVGLTIYFAGAILTFVMALIDLFFIPKDEKDEEIAAVLSLFPFSSWAGVCLYIYRFRGLYKNRKKNKKNGGQ